MSYQVFAYLSQCDACVHAVVIFLCSVTFRFFSTNVQFFKLGSNFASNENRRITMRYSNYVLYGCESDVLTWMVTSFGLNMAPTSTHRWSLLWPPTSSRNTGTPGLSSGGGGGGSDLDGLSEKARPCNDGLWWRQCFGEYSDAPTVSTPSDVRLDLILVASTSGGFCICTRRP